MATTENTYTGNGSLTTYSFTFPYLEESDVRVSLDGVDQPTTEYSFANATTINFNTAPGNGVAIRIYRQTAQDGPPATFFAGSAIRAQDLNDNFLQQLYVAQETDNIARNLTAGSIAPGAITNTLLGENSVTSSKIVDGTIVNADINASAEIAVSKLADGAARQLLQTDAAGTGVEWTDNVDVPGTLDVTGAATFDSTVTATGVATFDSAATFNSTVTTTGDATFNSTVTAAGDVTVPSLNGGPLAGTRNRIINGDMRIDQRNAGASVTPSNSYTLDRWLAYTSAASKFSVQQSSTAPTGFTKSLLATSLSAYTVVSSDILSLQYRIEGLNVADLAWGTASASTITLSFWVRSSLTGTFGGSIRNATGTRSYPFTYVISSANTFEYKTITIAGDTTGTWSTDNGVGIIIDFGLGVGSTYSGTAGTWAGANYASATGATSVVGTNGATFYITGVQLEPGTVATPFERRSYGQELALCQRYYYQTSQSSDFYGRAGTVSATTYHPIIHEFPVLMRIAPNFSATGATFSSANSSAFSNATTTRRHMTLIALSSTPNLDAYYLLASGSLTWSAEL